MSSMKFEKFDVRMNSAREIPVAKVANKGRVLVFNMACRKLGIERDVFVQFYIDRSEKVFAMSLTGNTQGVRLRSNGKNSGSVTVSATELLKAIGANQGDSFSLELDSVTELIVATKV